MELFNESIALPAFPTEKSLSGIGMSEWNKISDLLAQKFDFRNTLQEAQPKLDILNPGPKMEGAYDFIICSEVLEHVTQPVQIAFDNLARLLKPDGFLVLSVPWRIEGKTEEHFPDLYDWKIVELTSGFVLVNRTKAGVLQVFDRLVFHGGPGQTVEMRLFSKEDLAGNLEAAGFRNIVFAPIEASPEDGIIWEPWSRGLIARKCGGKRPYIPVSETDSAQVHVEAGNQGKRSRLLSKLRDVWSAKASQR